MRRLSLLLIALLLSAGTFTSAQAQCDSDKFMSNCQAKLNDGFTFLKNYTMNKAKSGKVEHSYVFSKDTTYLLSLCAPEGSPENMYVTLYDSNHNEILSSYDNKANKFMPLIGYQCKATGIYYLSFSFKDQAQDCGGSILAFKR